MKTAISLILCIVTLTAFSADVTFNLKDFIQTTQPLTRKTVMVVPKSTASASGNDLIMSERRYFNTGTNGTFTATNMVDGIYWCYAYGLTYTTLFRLNIPDTNGTIIASDYLFSGGSGIDTENGIQIDLE